MKILVINGPNLNLLGKREPEVYGTRSLSDLEQYVRRKADELGVEVHFFQSNHEGGLLDFIHEYGFDAQGIIINPGALTHYSYALREAISAVNLPTVEVHLTNIHGREEFRRISVVAPVCISQISGLGFDSYTRALESLHKQLAH